ncbi:sigma factor-like helix-turn-helix DNA-binding protein [Sedimentibacter sp.]|nr:sigma factor-like helix-turn-helix DNA-binding protein [Sedimentibacter sp.]
MDVFAVTDDIFEGMELERCLFMLPKSYYITLSLKHDDGYSYKEIAGILNITEENVKKRLMRARKKLREIINEQEAKI